MLIHRLLVISALTGVLIAQLPSTVARAGQCVSGTGSWGDKGVSSDISACVETSGDSGSNTPGGGSSSNGSQTCRRQGGSEIPCTVNGAWWSSTRQCYVVEADPQPPADAPLWAGRQGGSAYHCTTSGGQLLDGRLDLPTLFWLPACAVPGPDPAVLAQRAADTMHLKAVTVGLTPPPGSANPTRVGIPTWMWVNQSTSSTCGPATASASADGRTVTATAKVTGVTWDMGDGTRVSCGPGTPSIPDDGVGASPHCGHTYRKAGDCPVTATSHWAEDCSGAGQTGRNTFDLTARSAISVADACSVVTGQG